MTLRRVIRKLASGIERYGMARAVTGMIRAAGYKLLAPGCGVVQTVTDGLVLHFAYPSQFMPTLVVFKELVEPEYEYLRSILAKDAVFFDVGGGIGTYTVFAAQFVDGPIHTFEPADDNVAALRKNLEANRATHKVELNESALSNQRGLAVLEKSPNLFGSRITEVSAVPSQGAVAVRTLDDYCTERGIHHIDVLKIDAEGHEQQVLQGAGRLLATEGIGSMIVEADHRLAAFYNSLADNGFEAYYYDYRTNVLRKLPVITEDTVRASEPSGFSSNILFVHQSTLARHAACFDLR